MKRMTRQTTLGFVAISCIALLGLSHATLAYASFQGEIGPSISVDNPLAMPDVETNLNDLPSLMDMSINENHQKIAQEQLKQSGWMTNQIKFISEAPLSTEPAVGKTVNSEYANYKAIQKASSSAKLGGYTQYQKNLRDLVAQTTGKRINGIGVTYQFHFIFDETQKDTLIAAYVQPSIASEYGIDTLLPINTTPTSVDNTIKAFLKTNQAVATDKIAALDFPMALRSSNAKYNQLFINKFRALGWKDAPTTLYQNSYTLPLTENESNIGYFYFSSAQTLQGLKASNKVNLLPPAISKQTLTQYKPFPGWDAGWRSETQQKEAEANLDSSATYMPSFSEFYFMEKKYKLTNTQSFYIDFVADFSTTENNDEKQSTKTSIAYAFLVVKPAKKNSKGKLDRFIYAPNVKLSTIESDMKLYFAGKTPKYSIR